MSVAYTGNTATVWIQVCDVAPSAPGEFPDGCAWLEVPSANLFSATFGADEAIGLLSVLLLYWSIHFIFQMIKKAIEA